MDFLICLPGGIGVHSTNQYMFVFVIHILPLAGYLSYTVSMNHVFHAKKFSFIKINQGCFDGVIYLCISFYPKVFYWQILWKRINN